MATLKDLMDSAEDTLGDPRENIGRIVPFGFGVMDQRLFGVPIDRGGFFLVQGTSGARKTTMVMQFIVNQCLSGRIPQGYHICIDALESGMTIERYAQILWVMVATKYLVYWHWNECGETDIVRLLGMGLPEYPIEHLIEEVVRDGVRETVLSPEFLRYGMRTPRQQAALNMARAVVRNWPILLFGVSENPDPEVARALTTDTTNLPEAHKRWSALSEQYNMRQLVVDHMNEYTAPGQSDFEVQKLVVPTVASWLKPRRGLSWIIAQVGVTAEREARQLGIDGYSMGGKVAQAESMATWTVEYDKNNPYLIRLKRPVKSRIGMHPDIAIFIEPNSGASIGQAVEWRHLNG